MRAVGALLIVAMGLAGCAVPPPPPQIQPTVATPLPTSMSFAATKPLRANRSNTEMARDFLDLSFQLESGRTLPVFTRFEGPITIAVAGRHSPALNTELDRLLGRLRKEAHLSLRKTSNPAQASIRVEAISTKDLQQVIPEAACFVLPTNVSWDEFSGNLRRDDLDWAKLTERKSISVFIPIDTSRQEIRDCLHEEIAQGLGPLNDLYRLEDSVFNDDNLQSILTGFDMLMLRATYHPSLKSGMTRTEVAAQVPGILAALNPRGNTVPTRAYRPSDLTWVRDISRAIGPGSESSRRAAAKKALRHSEIAGWNDVRTALGLYTLGRLKMAHDGDAALEFLMAAGDIYRRRDATQIHAAHVGFQITAFALSSEQWDVALTLTDRYIPTIRRAENAALLCDMLLARATALQALDQPYIATQNEGLSWGIYAYGTTERVRQRAAEIQAVAHISKQ